MKKDSRWVALGVIAKPHGVKGELHVQPYNFDSDLLDAQERVWLKPKNAPHQEVRVGRIRRTHRDILMFIDGCSSRDDAEKMRGVEVCVPRELFPEPALGEYYHVDLEGLLARYPDGTEAGVVEKVISYPTIDCLRVAFKDGAVREVPMTEAYLVSVSINDGFVVLSRDVDEI